MCFMRESGKSNKKGAAIDTFQEMRAKRRRSGRNALNSSGFQPDKHAPHRGPDGSGRAHFPPHFQPLPSLTLRLEKQIDAMPALLHQRKDGLLVETGRQLLGVAGLLRREDLSTHIDQRLDVGIRYTFVLGLDVVDLLVVLDVGTMRTYVDIPAHGDALGPCGEPLCRDHPRGLRNWALLNGGSIAMGHPLGATGAIILGTLLDELERQDKTLGLATLCVGGGMGIATIIERI